MPNEPTLEGKAYKNFEKLLERKTTPGAGKVEYEAENLVSYLNLTVPEWRDMKKSGRLYDHLQHMLENAEGIRRFEVQLVWQRSTYMVGLILAFFAAFGIVASTEGDIVAGFPKTIILMALAFINCVFSFFFTAINIESKKLQRNWEYHADYLHELLDTRLMRAFFEKEHTLTAAEFNIAVGIFLMAIWAVIFFLLGYSFDNYILGTNILAIVPILPLPIVMMLWLARRLSKTKYEDLHLKAHYFERH